jgi:hypothetical protein
MSMIEASTQSHPASAGLSSVLPIRGELLPGLLAEIAALTDEATAVAIARAVGGERRYFPASPGSAHWLSMLIGVEQARLICRQLGGAEHKIPSARTYLRWWDARRLKDLGYGQRDIARRLGLTQGHVQRLLAGYDPNPCRVVVRPESCPRCGSSVDFHT